jgi:hypothetical protein
MFEDGDIVDIDYFGDTGKGIVCGYNDDYDDYIVELITRPKFSGDKWTCIMIHNSFLKKSETRF